MLIGNVPLFYPYSGLFHPLQALKGTGRRTATNNRLFIPGCLRCKIIHTVCDFRPYPGTQEMTTRKSERRIRGL